MLTMLIAKYSCRPRAKQYSRLHDRVESRVVKELDLIKMISRLRMLVLSTLGTLSSH